MILLFVTKKYKKYLTLGEMDSYVKFSDIIMHNSLFAVERLRRNGKTVWKIRGRGPEDSSCVGVSIVQIGEKLIHMDCDDENEVLWIFGHVGNYDQIRPAEDDDLCVRGDLLSYDCHGDRSLFKQALEESTIQIEEIA